MRLFFIHLKVIWFNFWQTIKYPKLWWIEIKFACSYLFCSPYTIFKREGSGIYGETPYSTYERIAHEARLLSGDCFYDLGCGRGKGLFWLSKYVKCRVVGIDKIAKFINLAKKNGETGMQFRCEDVLNDSFQDATVIYMYGLNWDEKQLPQLVQKLSRLKEGTRLITVSEPLKDPSFKIIKEFEGKFPWGRTSLYLQIIEKNDTSF